MNIYVYNNNNNNKQKTFALKQKGRIRTHQYVHVCVWFFDMKINSTSKHICVCLRICSHVLTQTNACHKVESTYLHIHTLCCHALNKRVEEVQRHT
jgi:hypothetical protein